MKKQHDRGLVLTAAVFVLVVLVFCLWLHTIQANDLARQEQTLEAALHKSILTCYALEGRYPRDFDYLMEHYPVIYDQTVFHVDYRFQGENLLPEVTILYKE